MKRKISKKTSRGLWKNQTPKQRAAHWIERISHYPESPAKDEAHRAINAARLSGWADAEVEEMYEAIFNAR